MHDALEMKPLYGTGQDAAVARALHRLGEIMAEREAANPTPEPPPEPWVDKPGSLIAAEKDVARWELVEQLQPAVCGGPGRCKIGRCRRAGQCAELERLRPMIEESRATLARERAQWKPPPTPPAPIRRARRPSPKPTGSAPPPRR
jgi:hypothetical protein